MAEVSASCLAPHPQARALCPWPLLTRVFPVMCPLRPEPDKTAPVPCRLARAIQPPARQAAWLCLAVPVPLPVVRFRFWLEARPVSVVETSWWLQALHALAWLVVSPLPLVLEVVWETCPSLRVQPRAIRQAGSCCLAARLLALKTVVPCALARATALPPQVVQSPWLAVLVRPTAAMLSLPAAVVVTLPATCTCAQLMARAPKESRVLSACTVVRLQQTPGTFLCNRAIALASLGVSLSPQGQPVALKPGKFRFAAAPTLMARVALPWLVAVTAAQLAVLPPSCLVAAALQGQCLCCPPMVQSAAAPSPLAPVHPVSAWPVPLISLLESLALRALWAQMPPSPPELALQLAGQPCLLAAPPDLMWRHRCVWQEPVPKAPLPRCVPEPTAPQPCRPATPRLPLARTLRCVQSPRMFTSIPLAPFRSQPVRAWSCAYQAPQSTAAWSLNSASLVCHRSAPRS